MSPAKLIVPVPPLTSKSLPPHSWICVAVSKLNVALLLTMLTPPAPAPALLPSIFVAVTLIVPASTSLNDRPVVVEPLIAVWLIVMLRLPVVAWPVRLNASAAAVCLEVAKADCHRGIVRLVDVYAGNCVDVLLIRTPLTLTLAELRMRIASAVPPVMVPASPAVSVTVPMSIEPPVLFLELDRVCRSARGAIDVGDLYVVLASIVMSVILRIWPVSVVIVLFAALM